MTRRWKLLLGCAAALATFQASAQIVFFEHDNFAGHTYVIERSVPNLGRFGFNDRASSVIVRKGQWDLCEHIRFGGRCVTLRPGRYASLNAMGMNDRVSSARRLPNKKPR